MERPEWVRLQRAFTLIPPRFVWLVDCPLCGDMTAVKWGRRAPDVPTVFRVTADHLKSQHGVTVAYAASKGWG